MFARGVVLTILCRMRYVCQRSGSYNPLSYEACLPEEWFLQSFVVWGMFARGVVLTIPLLWQTYLIRQRIVRTTPLANIPHTTEDCKNHSSGKHTTFLTILCRMRYACQRSGSYNPLSYEVCLPEEWFRTTPLASIPHTTEDCKNHSSGKHTSYDRGL
jgi:hypothetical protein